MAADNIVIEELVLRVPGIRADEAPGLVGDVMRRVQAALGRGARVDELRLAQLRVRVPEGATRDELVRRIADQMVEALR